MKAVDSLLVEIENFSPAYIDIDCSFGIVDCILVNRDYKQVKIRFSCTAPVFKNKIVSILTEKLLKDYCFVKYSCRNLLIVSKEYIKENIKTSSIQNNECLLLGCNVAIMIENIQQKDSYDFIWSVLDQCPDFYNYMKKRMKIYKTEIEKLERKNENMLAAYNKLSNEEKLLVELNED